MVMAETVTHNVGFLDEIIVITNTTDPHAVAVWIDGVNRDRDTVGRLVGIEVEFHNNTSHIGTVQLCVGGRCLVYQPLDATHGPPSLNQFLANRGLDHVFVGTNMQRKTNLLCQQLRIGSFRNCLNLTEVAPELGVEKQRLLSENVAWTRVETDWGRPNRITVRQARYACLDAFLNLHLAKAHWDNFD